MDVQDRGFIITGGASGLGLETARMLRDAGARVGVLDLKAAGGWDGPFAAADVSDADQAGGAVRRLAGEIGGLHGVLNCAGGGGSGLCVGEGATLTPELFRRALLVNTLGSFIVCQAAATLMKDNAPTADGERGVLVNVSSIVALEGQVGTAGYAAAKGGINAMTLPLAREFAAFGVRVMTIAPGIFDTPMFLNARGPMVAWLRGQVQHPARAGKASEFAAFVRQIIENPMLNGEVVRLDGAFRVPAGEAAWWGRPG
jgi:3-hydroxyacyl-CoA dehydrogenase / 3-hydroxy-2-methylbutyryl-CoA dehydrogenase